MLRWREEADRLVTRGVSVRVQRSGTGAPILFLHGAGGWPAWLPFFDRLSQHYALSVPEHPCFGASDDPPWLRSVADLAMHYLDFLDQVYSSPVHVIGHSLGGWTAAEAADPQHPSHRQPDTAGAGGHPHQRHSAR